MGWTKILQNYAENEKFMFNFKKVHVQKLICVKTTLLLIIIIINYLSIHNYS